MKTLRCSYLGLVPYAEAEALQGALVAARRRGETEDALLLLEHPPVVTLGRGARAAHVLLTPQEMAARGIEIHEAGRGGDVTYHGPGQLVGYPIVALEPGRRDAHRYLRDLESALIATARAFGVVARRVPGLTGIWAGEAKLAAIGVRIGTGWITSHGFSINVEGDLSGFDGIVPCGLHGKGVTSLERLTGGPIPLETVAAEAAQAVATALGREEAWASEPAVAAAGAR